MPYKYDDDTDNDDSDHYERDPGGEVIEKNMRNRLQRVADNTKDELNKVLKRVDTVCNLIYFIFLKILFKTLFRH
jgi:hypothetical protein